MRAGSQRCFILGWKPCIDRLIRVDADLEVRTMVVGVVAILVSAMGRHELDHLQDAFCASDIRNRDIGFLFVIERRDVHEQAVGKNRR